MKLLKELSKFYHNEAQGLGHYDDDLATLGWYLAETLEEAGIDSNACKDEDEFTALVDALRTQPTSTIIDSAVNEMHQGLLDEIDRSGEESELMMALGGDIVEYLLHREEHLESQGWQEIDV
jgi:hypothetical protein